MLQMWGLGTHLEAVLKLVETIVRGGSGKYPSATSITSPHRREEPNSISIKPSSTCPFNQQAEEWAGTATAPVNKSAEVNESGKGVVEDITV